MRLRNKKAVARDNWSSRLIEHLCSSMTMGVLDCLHNNGRTRCAIHLAVFRKPYLDLILEGRKTVESRFASRRIAPYEVVSAGDVLALKHSSGPVVGACLVGSVEFFNLDREKLKWIRKRYASKLCANGPSFWAARSGSRYATLIHIAQVVHCPSFECKKNDRRGWVVVRSRDEQI